MLDLARGEGTPDFSDADLAVIDEAVPALARRIRRAIARPSASDEPLPEGTSVIILDEVGEILSMTSDARENLALLPETLNAGTSSAIFLNAIVHAVWARARFLASGLEAPPARARIVLRDGRRMTLRGSCTRTESGGMGHTVLTLEPTRRSQLGPLLLATYELTDREEEIVSLLLRGDSAQQIATRLGISLHTVRTHTKRIHDKTGVSSRAELTMLFIDEEFLPNADITTHVAGQP